MSNPVDHDKAPPSLDMELSSMPEHAEFQDVDEGRFDLNWFLEIVTRHLGTFLCIFAVAFLLGLFLFLRESPEYVAQAELKIEPKRPVFDLQEFSSVDYINENFYLTQLRLLESDNLVQEVIRTIGLDRFQGEMNTPTLIDSMLALVGVSSDEAAPRSPGEDGTVAEINLHQLRIAYQNSLTIQMDRRAPQIIYVAFTAPDPQLAADVANTHANVFIDRSIQSNTIFTDDYIQGLQQNITSLDSRISALNQSILEYKKEHNFFQIQGMNSFDPIQDIDDRLSRIRVQLAEANNMLINASAAYESIYREDEVGNSDALMRDVITSRTLESLRERRSTLLEQWSEVRETYLERHPTYISVLNQLMSVEDSIDEEITTQVMRLKKDHDEAESRYLSLLDQEQTLIQEKYQRDEEWNTLNQMESNRDQLNDQKLTVMKDLQNAQSSLESQIASRSRTFEIVDEALVPQRPTNRNWIRILLLTLAAALSAAFTAILFIEYQDQSLRTSQQVEKASGLQVLASIPSFDPNESASLTDHLADESYSPVNDAFTALRTRLLFSGGLQSMQCILFSSASPDEGKSTVCINLASSLALVGKRVCVIDADVRKPQIHQFFGEAHSPGLVDLVRKNTTLERVMFEADVPGLYVIPAGTSSDHATELLSSPLMPEILDTLKSRFDFVFIDSAPVLVTSEPAILSGVCDTTMMVVRAGKLTAIDLQSALETIRRSGGNPFAVILNGVQARNRMASVQYAYDKANMAHG